MTAAAVKASASPTADLAAAIESWRATKPLSEAAMGQLEAVTRRWLTQLPGRVRRGDLLAPENGLSAVCLSESLRESVRTFLDWPWDLLKRPAPQRVGLVWSGNVALNGLASLLRVLLGGGQAIVKLSSRDQSLPRDLFATWADALGALPLLWIDYDHRDEARHRHVRAKVFAAVNAMIVYGSQSADDAWSGFSGPRVFHGPAISLAHVLVDEPDRTLGDLARDCLLFGQLGCLSVKVVMVWAAESQQIRTFSDRFTKALASEANRLHLPANYSIASAKAAYLLREMSFRAAIDEVSVSIAGDTQAIVRVRPWSSEADFVDEPGWIDVIPVTKEDIQKGCMNALNPLLKAVAVSEAMDLSGALPRQPILRPAIGKMQRPPLNWPGGPGSEF